MNAHHKLILHSWHVPMIFNSVSYLSNWDKSMPNLDVIDDYQSERGEIQRVRGANFPFSFGDYIVKSLFRFYRSLVNLSFILYLIIKKIVLILGLMHWMSVLK